MCVCLCVGFEVLQGILSAFFLNTSIHNYPPGEGEIQRAYIKETPRNDLRRLCNVNWLWMLSLSQHEAPQQEEPTIMCATRLGRKCSYRGAVGSEFHAW